MTKKTCADRRAKRRQDEPLTITVPEAGWRYFGLGETASYAAAERGDIPYIQVGGLKRVPIMLMEEKLASAGVAATKAAALPTPPGRRAGSVHAREENGDGEKEMRCL